MRIRIESILCIHSSSLYLCLSRVNNELLSLDLGFSVGYLNNAHVHATC